MLDSHPSTAFFGHLPETGPWTTVGLTRGQFVAIFLVSVGLFVVIDGPLWAHLHDHHTLRLGGSYLAIPALVTIALWRNDRLTLGRWLAGNAVIGLAKLMATAALLVLLTLAR